LAIKSDLLLARGGIRVAKEAPALRRGAERLETEPKELGHINDWGEATVGRKIYISGKVTGDPDYGEKFIAEADRLRALGYRPVNPTAQIPEDESWPSAMRIALGAMLACDGVSLLPGWRESRGAKVEERLTRELEMDVRASHEWDGGAKP